MFMLSEKISAMGYPPTQHGTQWKSQDPVHELSSIKTLVHFVSGLNFCTWAETSWQKCHPTSSDLNNCVTYTSATTSWQQSRENSVVSRNSNPSAFTRTFWRRFPQKFSCWPTFRSWRSGRTLSSLSSSRSWNLRHPRFSNYAAVPSKRRTCTTMSGRCPNNSSRTWPPQRNALTQNARACTLILVWGVSSLWISAVVSDSRWSSICVRQMSRSFLWIFHSTVVASIWRGWREFCSLTMSSQLLRPKASEDVSSLDLLWWFIRWWCTNKKNENCNNIESVVSGHSYCFNNNSC